MLIGKNSGISPIKRVIFCLVLSALVVLGVEISSFLIYSISAQEWFSFSRMQERRRETFLPELYLPEAGKVPDEVIHPYLGYVANPDSNSEEKTRHQRGYPISRFGFRDRGSPIRQRSAGKILLGITGGSFAADFSFDGVDSLIAELRKDPLFSGKEFSIIRFSIGGYKQPQQLMALNYLLSLGAQFDILINIDGFNEVALPPVENMPKNVFPFFPRNWFFRVRSMPDLPIWIGIGKLAYLKDLREIWAKAFSWAPLRFSVTA
ncbi:MAG: hypothetical protein ACE5JU_25735, partial [Candidatus Binatia bacterium]